MSVSSRSREISNKKLRYADRLSSFRWPSGTHRLVGILQNGWNRISNAAVVSTATDSIASLSMSAANKLRSHIPERSLINEILMLQLCYAIFVGGLAIVGLWWTSTWAIEDNLQKWGERWISELDDLAIPLYTTESENKFVQIENGFIKDNSANFHSAELDHFVNENRKPVKVSLHHI